MHRTAQQRFVGTFYFIIIIAEFLVPLNNVSRPTDTIPTTNYYSSDHKATNLNFFPHRHQRQTLANFPAPSPGMKI